MSCQFGFDKILGIKIVDFGSYLDSVIRCIKTCNISNAAFTFTVTTTLRFTRFTNQNISVTLQTVGTGLKKTGNRKSLLCPYNNYPQTIAKKVFLRNLLYVINGMLY